MTDQPDTLTKDERVTIARNAEGMDILHNVLDYLEFAWGIDTPRGDMQANLDARIVLIRCKTKLYNEGAAILGIAPITGEELREAANGSQR